jgi:ABC-type branched-subunit amino acid transport system substrate-binding protein
LPRSTMRTCALLFSIFALALLAGCAPPAMVPAPGLAPQVAPLSPPPSPAPPPAAAPAKVGLLVPLSGVNRNLGKAMLDAAGLALFETGSDRIELVPRDTAGTPEGASKAAKAVLKKGARLILGPLLKAEVDAVKPIAEEAGVNVIAFSTATDLAGANIFLMGFLPRQEVIREVSYAREQGYRRFAALASDAAYGHLMVHALRDAVSRSGGEVTAVAYFDPQKGGVAAAVAQLTGQGRENAGPPNFDALMAPEGGERLKKVAGALAAAGLDTSRVQLLGSGLWDEPDTGQERELVGGWFAAPDPAAWRGFARRFEKAYGYKPPRLASLAYDAAGLAAVLAKGESGQPFSRAAILNPRGFSGVDGLFRFTPDGLVERGLAMLKVAPEGEEVLSAAPQSFENLGY